MHPDRYRDELWDEIPETAFIALGRRGKDTIDLHQCFNPTCDNCIESTIHPLEKHTKDLTSAQSGEIHTHQLIFDLFCEKCKTEFQLVFKRHFLEEAPSSEGTPTNGTTNQHIVLEQVSAKNLHTNESYGEIGYVQYRY